MDKRQRIALGSGLAIAAALVGGLAITLPAQAASGQQAPASPSGAVENGTNDGETNDDGADANDPADNGVEDGTVDGETNDD
jgi:hypothetical protein